MINILNDSNKIKLTQHYLKEILSMLTVFVCGLFNNSISSSDYTVSNGSMINELERIWKDVVMAAVFHASFVYAGTRKYGLSFSTNLDQLHEVRLQL